MVFHNPIDTKIMAKRKRPRTWEEKVSWIRASLKQRLEHYAGGIKCVSLLETSSTMNTYLLYLRIKSFALKKGGGLNPKSPLPSTVGVEMMTDSETWI